MEKVFALFLIAIAVISLNKTFAQNALAIDNTLSEAYAELEWTKIYQDFDWKGGEKGLKLAIELNPSDARAHRYYSRLLTFVGRHQEAIIECSRIENPDWIAAYVYGIAGEREKTLEILECFTEKSKTQYVNPTDFTGIYLGLGEKEKAMDYLEKAYKQHEGW